MVFIVRRLPAQRAQYLYFRSIFRSPRGVFAPDVQSMRADDECVPQLHRRQAVMPPEGIVGADMNTAFLLQQAIDLLQYRLLWVI